MARRGDDVPRRTIEVEGAPVLAERSVLMREHDDGASNRNRRPRTRRGLHHPQDSQYEIWPVVYRRRSVGSVEARRRSGSVHRRGPTDARAMEPRGAFMNSTCSCMEGSGVRREKEFRQQNRTPDRPAAARRRGRGPPRSAGSNEVPQPQERAALGLWILKPLSFSESSKSTLDPRR